MTRPPKQALYLVGIPGSGKSTLLRMALAGIPVHHERWGLLTYLRYPGGIELGARRRVFSGTDALPMHIQPFVTAWLESACPYRALIAEGDRLANDQFFATLLRLGWQLTVVWLECPEDLAAARRAQRGFQQNAAWIVGRVTKVQHLVDRCEACVWRLNAMDPVASLVAQLQAHPVCQRLTHVARPYDEVA